MIQATLELVGAVGRNALCVEELGSRMPVSPDKSIELFGSRKRLIAEVLRRWGDLTRE